MEIILVSGKNVVYKAENIDVSSLTYRYTMPYLLGLYSVKLTMAGMDYSAIILFQTYAEGIAEHTCKILNEVKFQQSATVSLEIVDRSLEFTISNAASTANFTYIKMC